MQARTLVIGEALIDIVKRPDGRTEEHPGGSPMNVAIGLARLDHVTELATWLGDDENGLVVQQHLAHDNVPLAQSDRRAERTATATATMDERGHATYEFDLTWDVDDSPEPFEHVHTGSIASVLEPGATVVRDILRRRRDAATVSYDPNPRPSLIPPAQESRPRIEEIIALSDVVKASDEDIAWLYGDDADLRQVLTDWCRSGPAVAVVTRGEAGALVHLREGEHVFEVPGRRTEVADTIGAGDSFMSGLISGLLDQGLLGGPDGRARLAQASPEEIAAAVDRAVLASSITVSRDGAQPPLRSELPTG